MKMIVIGASAGSLEPMQHLVAHLEQGIDAAILLVRHVSPDAQCLLATILQNKSALPVRNVEHGMPVEAGTIYVAPPGRNVMLDTLADGRPSFVSTRIDAGERGTPSIDKALVSAARLFSRECIGVVLSGYLDDGTRGAQVLDAFDGVMIVQHPDQAVHSSMPWNVIQRDSPDYVLEDIPIAELLNELASHGEATDYLESRRVS